MPQRSKLICIRITTAITGKIDEDEVINVLEDPEDQDSQQQSGDQTMANMVDSQHAPLIQTDAGARDPQLRAMVRSKAKG